MSGFAAVVTFDGSVVPPRDVEVMVKATPWRGDVVDRWSGDGAAFVVQRHPPPRVSTSAITSANGLVVVADARIDNRRELAASLGLHANAAGDASLIAAAFRRWGTSFAARLIGDFSIAVWDIERRRIVIARDPMGMRPLYYRIQPRRRMVLASEAKQILLLPTVSRRVNEAAVGAYLLTDTSLEGDESYWQTVSQLREAHVLSCDASAEHRQLYWAIDPDHRILHADRPAAAAHVAQVLTEAVVARLEVSSAPAIMLSGGMDSGSVAAVAGRHHERTTHATAVPAAYSWAFDELIECDERHISRRIVDYYGLRQRDIPADHAGPLDGYPGHEVDLDDPVVGAFQPVIERTLQHARRDGIDVMLGGDRGDLVLGPTTYGHLSLLLAHRWRDVVLEVSEQRDALGESLLEVVRRDVITPLAYRLRRRSLAGWVRWMTDRVTRRDRQQAGRAPWVSADLVRHREGVHDPASAGLQPSRVLRHGLIFTPLHMRGMVWSERTYAQHGVQFADPFSDRRLVELVLALPQAHVGRPNDDRKPLLREAMRGVMPESARSAAKKILPSPLYARALKRNRPIVEHLLTGSRAHQRGWLDSGALRAHYDGWLAGGPLDASFWYALSVERWLRVIDAG